MSRATSSGQELSLPLELLEAIVDVLGREHLKQRPGSSAHPTLSALSLTCRGLVPRCRKYIFRTVRLGYHSAWGSGYTYPRPNSSRVQAFLALLTEQQSDALGAPIGVYIRVLRIEDNLSPLLPQITAILPNLQEFCIRSNTNGRDEKLFFEYQALHEVAGGNVEELSQDAIDSMVSSDERVYEVMKRLRDTRWLLPLNPLHLNRLSIDADFSSVDVLPVLNFLMRCLHLEIRLYTILDAVHWPLPDDAATPRREISVRRLELHGNRWGGLLRFMMGPEYFRRTLDNLKYLYLQLLDGGDLHERSYLSLLSYCTTSLEGLEINLSGCRTNELALNKLKDLDLSTLRKLRHLKLVNWPRSDQAKLSSLPDGISSLFSVYGPSSSSLETVQASIQRRKSRLYEPADWSDSDGSWERLKRLITTGKEGTQRAPAFRNLVSFRVSFTLRDFFSGRGAERTIETMLKAGEEARKLLDLGGGIEASVILTA